MIADCRITGAASSLQLRGKSDMAAFSFAEVFIGINHEAARVADDSSLKSTLSSMPACLSTTSRDWVQYYHCTAITRSILMTDTSLRNGYRDLRQLLSFMSAALMQTALDLHGTFYTSVEGVCRHDWILGFSCSSTDSSSSNNRILGRIKFVDFSTGSRF